MSIKYPFASSISLQIDEYGFVELSNILPKGLIKQIREEASTKVNVWQEHKNNMELLDTPRNKRKLSSDVEVEEISNALQMNVTGTCRARTARNTANGRDACYAVVCSCY